MNCLGEKIVQEKITQQTVQSNFSFVEISEFIYENFNF